MPAFRLGDFRVKEVSNKHEPWPTTVHSSQHLLQMAAGNGPHIAKQSDAEQRAFYAAAIDNNLNEESSSRDVLVTYAAYHAALGAAAQEVVAQVLAHSPKSLNANTILGHHDPFSLIIAALEAPVQHSIHQKRVQAAQSLMRLQLADAFPRAFNEANDDLRALLSASLAMTKGNIPQSLRVDRYPELRILEVDDEAVAATAARIDAMLDAGAAEEDIVAAMGRMVNRTHTFRTAPRPAGGAAAQDAAASAPVDVNAKVAYEQDSQLVAAALREHATLCCAVEMVKRRRAPEYAVLGVALAAIAAADAKYNITTLRVAAKDSERARGSVNNAAGHDIEDAHMALLPDGSPSEDVKHLVAALLRVTLRCGGHGGTHTRIGSVPQQDAASNKLAAKFQHAPCGDFAYRQPTRGDVDDWSAWFAQCVRETTPPNGASGRAELLTNFAERCRQAQQPCLVLLRGVKVKMTSATRRDSTLITVGELDFVLYEAVSRQVLLVGEMKATPADLIGARRQRIRFVQRLQAAPAPHPNPKMANDGQLHFFLDPLDAPLGITLDVPQFAVFLKEPVWRWLSITLERSGVGALPSCVKYTLAPRLGKLLGSVGWSIELPPEERAKKVEHALSLSAELRDVTRGLQGLWFAAKKQGYESPMDLCREAQHVNFSNILVLKPIAGKDREGAVE